MLGSAIGVALLIALVVFLVTRPQDVGPPVLAAEPLPESIPVAGMSMGPEDAPVTVVEWGDFTWPGCKEFTRAVKPQLVSNYVEPGIVRFEFHDYAFRGPEAVRAAEAAACAADQGAYWRFHDTLYLNQSGPNSFTDARLKQMAETLGLDTGTFNQCLDSGEKKADVEASIAEAQAQGIDSTPTIIINGTEIAEWHDYNAVKQAIDAKLAGA
jgi:protein-disulfide isomerase